MLAGGREILIITTPQDAELFRPLLGDGSALGMSFSYAVQPEPKGLAQAFTIGADFLAGDAAALIPGDHVLYRTPPGDQLRRWSDPSGGCVFAYHVADPERYGVVEFDESGT